MARSSAPRRGSPSMEENILVHFGMPAARLQAVNDCYQAGHHILARWAREPGHNLTLIARNRSSNPALSSGEASELGVALTRVGHSTGRKDPTWFIIAEIDGAERRRSSS